MNLKEILNYRQNCVICQKPLTTKTFSGLITVIDHDGLWIKIKNKKGKIDKVGFLYSGGIYNLELMSDKFSADFITYCSFCENDSSKPHISGDVYIPRTIVLKGRQPGMSTMLGANGLSNSTLADLYKKSTRYTWSQNKNSPDLDFKLRSDIIRYHNDSHFYHIVNDIEDDKSYVNYGSFNKTAKDIFCFSRNSMNTSKIQTVDQLINKIETYIIFS